ncbi:MAG: lipid-A-disaccharide synthase [Paludibacteraceae bacterium]|nr:lipid-A-disaccharide synthase [Paludibacteraceae bacterium]
MAKYFLIAGEASGDTHASALIEQLRVCDSNASFVGLGGDKMAAAGCRLYRHYSRMAFMGFVAVLQNIRTVCQNFHIAQDALLAEQPDALILIDYPSFNLRIAAFCRKLLPNTKIFYYIPPKVWAWKRRRVHQIARLCDEVLGIFPFEPAFYAKYGYQCTYVGNPTREEIEKYRNNTTRQNIIAILPGSRKSEVLHCLPKMLTAARRFADYKIVIAAAPGLNDEVYQPYLLDGEKLTRDTYSVVSEAKAAIVNSGTATLETALLGCPQVAVYHLAFSQLIGILRWARPLIFDIPYFTLVNILAGKEVIHECIANDFTERKIVAALESILYDGDYTQKMLAQYEHIYSVLGASSPSATAAKIICKAILH